MKNELQIFNNNEFGNVRTMIKNNEIWFVGKDVAECLGYKDTRSTVSKKVDKDDRGVAKINSRGGFQNTTIINKKGVISLITTCTNVTKNTKINFIKFLKQNELIDKNLTVIVSRKEIEFLDMLKEVLEPFNYQCFNQYHILNKYKVDLYIKNLNIIIEYDEKNHDCYTYEQHEGRQKEIENELGCKFIRVSDDKNHLWNIGFIMKELTKGMVA